MTICRSKLCLSICLLKKFCGHHERMNFTLKFYPGGEVLPYMGYIGMCHCEGYGFQAVYSRIGYINQSVWV